MLNDLEAAATSCGWTPGAGEVAAPMASLGLALPFCRNNAQHEQTTRALDVPLWQTTRLSVMRRAPAGATSVPVEALGGFCAPAIDALYPRFDRIRAGVVWAVAS